MHLVHPIVAALSPHKKLSSSITLCSHFLSLSTRSRVSVSVAVQSILVYHTYTTALLHLVGSIRLFLFLEVGNLNRHLTHFSFEQQSNIFYSLSRSFSLSLTHYPSIHPSTYPPHSLINSLTTNITTQHSKPCLPRQPHLLPSTHQSCSPRTSFQGITPWPMAALTSSHTNAQAIS